MQVHTGRARLAAGLEVMLKDLVRSVAPLATKLRAGSFPNAFKERAGARGSMTVVVCQAQTSNMFVEQDQRVLQARNRSSLSKERHQDLRMG